jgi:hypothetical protein
MNLINEDGININDASGINHEDEVETDLNEEDRMNLQG